PESDRGPRRRHAAVAPRAWAGRQPRGAAPCGLRCECGGAARFGPRAVRQHARGIAERRLDVVRPRIRGPGAVDGSTAPAMTAPRAAARRTAVVALGGNALAPSGEASTVYDQFRHTRESLGP